MLARLRSILVAPLVGLTAAMPVPAVAGAPTLATLGVDRTGTIPVLCVTNLGACVASLGSWQGGTFFHQGDGGQLSVTAGGTTQSLAAWEAANAAASAAGLKAANALSELVTAGSQAAARANLGLGAAATLPVGPGGVAGFGDSRIVGAVQAGGGDGSAVNATPAGGTAAGNIADWLGQSVNVLAYGAKGDYKIKTTAVTISAGSNALAVGDALFSPADCSLLLHPGAGCTGIVGGSLPTAAADKVIYLPGTGPAPAVGRLMNTPVTSPGVYAGVPSVVLGGNGTGASGVATMAMQSVTLGSGGTCPTAGTFNFLVRGSTLLGRGNQASVQGTVAGGVVTALTLLDGGNYTVLPTGTLSLFGGGCTGQPTMTATWGVKQVLINNESASGYDATSTVSLSGGSPTTSAVLGAPVVNYVTPLVPAKIVGYTDPKHVTLDTAATTALAGVSEQIGWGTDNTAAIQAAWNASYTLGKNCAYFPAGSYLKAYGTAIDPGAGPACGRGEGKFASFIVWDGGPNNTVGDGPLFYNIAGGTKTTLEFVDMGVRGLLDTGRLNVGGPAFLLNNYARLSWTRFSATWAPNMVMQNEAEQGCQVSLSFFDNNMRDMARCRSTPDFDVEDNYFGHGEDDAVAAHQAGYLPSGPQHRRRVRVSRNTFVDNQGASIIGGEEIQFDHNTCVRTKYGCVRVGYTPSEGALPIFSIDVSDNETVDMLTRFPFVDQPNAPYTVTTLGPRAGSGDATLIPGTVSALTGLPVAPWQYLDGDLGNAATPNPPVISVAFINNKYHRTLGSGGAYSSTWKKGQMLTVTGFQDPVVPEFVMRPTSCMVGPLNALPLRFLDNDCQDTYRGATISGDLFSASMTDVLGTGNHFTNAIDAGFYFDSTVSGTVNARFGLNGFNLDPWAQSDGRGSLGSWLSAFAKAVAYDAYTNIAGVILTGGDLHQEEYQPYSARITNPACTGQSVVRGQFAQLAYSSFNYGVGLVPSDGGCFLVQKTFNAWSQSPNGWHGLNGAHPTEAATMPTSGSFYPGEFVLNTNPSTTNAIYGWKRIGTNTTYILGVDWVIVPAGNGVAPAVAAAGTTQATATALTQAYDDVTTGTGGVALAATLNSPVRIWNDTASAITVYPGNGSGQSIGGAASVSLAAGATAGFMCMTATTCRQTP